MYLKKMAMSANVVQGCHNSFPFIFITQKRNGKKSIKSRVKHFYSMLYTSFVKNKRKCQPCTVMQLRNGEPKTCFVSDVILYAHQHTVRFNKRFVHKEQVYKFPLMYFEHSKVKD